MVAKSVKFSAPGKIILSGEHAVVYGYPAIAAAISLRLTIDNFGKIESSIPIGAGLGSSAAFAVASSALRLGKLNLETINNEAYELEKLQHGKPSGLDNTVATYGGFLWYRKESESYKTFRNISPKKKIEGVYLINTGKPAETTGQMIRLVADAKVYKEVYFDVLFREIEKISKRFLGFLLNDNSDDFEELISSNEKLLENLGVVSESTKGLIRKIEKIGGAAKITGAGGKKDASGMIIVYYKDQEKLLNFAKKNNINLLSVKLGEEGVRIGR
jgi:mevalonate kinase